MRKITQSELASVVKRIMAEAETQSRFNRKEFKGLTPIEICDRVRERLGGDWEVVKDGDTHA